MKYAVVLLAILMTACSPSAPRDAGGNKADQDYTQGEFYFRKAAKVDNKGYGPHIYRVENDEVICYVMGSEGGLQCKWKENR